MEVDGKEMSVEEFLNSERQSNNLRDYIVHLTECLTPIADMAVLVGMSESELRELLRKENHYIAVAYRKAKVNVSLRMRKQLLERAEAGAPTAIEEVKNLYSAFNKDNP